MPGSSKFPCMLDLAVLGGVTLSRNSLAIPWTHRGWQRAALLALLADAGSRGLDRGLLASLLWPDSADGAARHSLDELLSKARRELGSKELFAGGTTLTLNLTVVETDIRAFEQAVASRQLERAAALYRGPFADGLRTGNSDELEKRLGAIRRRYAEEYTRVLDALAQAAAQRSDHRGASRWRRRIADRIP